MELLSIVSKQYPLNNKYIPTGLIYEPIANTWMVEEVYHHFYELNLELQQNGLSSLRVMSAYRSYEYQKLLFNKKLKEFLFIYQNRQIAIYEAEKCVMLPGQSEHQLGLALDITLASLMSYEDPFGSLEYTIQYKWLLKNCIRFGFILRYPRHKVALTGVEHKPYHFRYVGINHAKKMQRLNLCLEEYVAEHLNLKVDYSINN